MKQLLNILKNNFPQSSHRTFKTWLLKKRVYINNKPARSITEQVEEGQSVTLRNNPPKRLDGLVILYEDDDFVVIEKPSGLLSVATPKNPYCAHSILKKAFGKTKVYVVHRLDQFTSGVMAFALNQKANIALKEQFYKKSAKRSYVAVLEGNVEQKGVWKDYLKESVSTKMHIAKNGQVAITYFQKIAQSAKFCFVFFELKTGRKNQLRVQSQAHKAPITGDKKYGAQHDPFKRLGLHAIKLELFHPTTHKKMTFFSKMPSIFLKPFKVISKIETFLKAFDQKQTEQTLLF
jgi:RluA family pseudouridine synthase